MQRTLPLVFLVLLLVLQVVASTRADGSYSAVVVGATRGGVQKEEPRNFRSSLRLRGDDQDSTCEPEAAGDGSVEKNGLLRTLGSVAMALLPSPRTLSQRDADARRRQEEARPGLPEWWLKEAPLPFRVVGNLLNPVVSRAVSVLMTSSVPPGTVQHYLQQAHDLLSNHPQVIDLLGHPLLIAPSPFTEKSTVVATAGNEQSTTTTTRIELSFTVSGSKEAGVAYLSATEEGGIDLLRVTTVKGHRSVDVIVQQPNTHWIEADVKNDNNEIEP